MPFSVSVPVKSFNGFPSVMVVPVSVVVPGTMIAPVCEIAPEDVTARLPVSVVAGSETLDGPPRIVRFAMLVIGPVAAQLPVLVVVSELPPPLMVELKSMPPVPDESATLPPSVSGELMVMAVFVVVMFADKLIPAASVSVTAPRETIA